MRESGGKDHPSRLLTSDVSLFMPSQGPLAGNAEFSLTQRHNRHVADIEEVEAKLLTIDGKNDFPAILAKAAQTGALVGSIREKKLYSSYQDTPDLDIHNNRLCLRLRYEHNEGGIGYKDIDISTKTIISPLDTDPRKELETGLGDDLIIDLNRLFDAYTHDPVATRQLLDLINIFGNDPENLREIFFSECKRKLFKAAVYIIRQDNGSSIVKFGNQLNGDSRRAKRAVFEFALDFTRYYATDSKTGLIVPLGKDDEIEWEFRKNPCHLDPEAANFRSDLDIRLDEVYLAQQFIQKHIVEAAVANPASLICSGRSKQERGYQLRQTFTGIEFPDHPTISGNPVETLPIKREKRGAYDLYSAPGNTRGRS